MPPPFYDSHEDTDKNEDVQPANLTEMAFWYMIVLIAMLLLWLVLFFCLRIIALRQKTRSPQQRRMYAGSRPRQSLGAQEPTIYVSPSNLPPPPKYEFMAPPSYEEVVGIHYPNYAVQPIAQPINNALAQGSSNTPTVTITNNTTDNDSTNNAPATVTVTTEVRRNSVTPART